ncbi:MAG: hypothetical protein KDA85_10355, partial [Planctomycetaceae bacterium]|nr:hypothetical protein [Planctomycetaceae bacterium]
MKLRSSAIHRADRSKLSFPTWVYPGGFQAFALPSVLLSVDAQVAQKPGSTGINPGGGPFSGYPTAELRNFKTFGS